MNTYSVHHVGTGFGYSVLCTDDRGRTFPVSVLHTSADDAQTAADAFTRRETERSAHVVTETSADGSSVVNHCAHCWAHV